VISAGFDRMSEGGQWLIWGVRHWMVAVREARYVSASVARSFEAIGGRRFYHALTALVLLAARDADRPLIIHPPCCAELSSDEESLARILAALTNGSPSAAAVHFRTLLGREPSTALRRYAKAVASRFKAVGMTVAFGAAPSHRMPRAADQPSVGT
jgi:hypothetical protein